MVDYDKFAETFSNSRINMKWEEIDYFVSFIKSLKINNLDNVLDIGCGNGRLIKSLKDSFEINNYVGVDLSENLLYEAKRNNPSFNFISGDMLEIDNLFFDSKIFNFTFLIASFHHLEKFEERILFLEKLKNVILKNSFIFMTNWALNSSINKTKYEKSIIKGSENKFGGCDYNIKIGNYSRFYHCFSKNELEYLFKEVGFDIIENRLFENNKNFISILSNK